MGLKILQRENMKILHAAVAALGLARMPIFAQSTFTDANWVRIGGLASVNGAVNSLVTDTNGNIYVGGNFSIPGQANANAVAKWNGSSWSSLGSGLAGAGTDGKGPYVTAMAFDAAGNLYVAGDFSIAGGVNATNIAKWNGSSWSTAGSGINGIVSSLSQDTQGNIYAGGNFTTAGNVSASGVAKWNGNSWAPLGPGVGGTVSAIAADASGNVYAGGIFTTAGNTNALNVAKWDGARWSPLGVGVGGPVSALLFDKSENLYVAGTFNAAGGASANSIALWTGSAWSPLAATYEVNATTSALALDAKGTVYVSWQSLAPNQPFLGAVYDAGIVAIQGTNWTPIAGGGFQPDRASAGPKAQQAFAAMAFDASGKLYAGGDFNYFPGIPANYLSIWNENSWSPLVVGPTYKNSVPTVNSLTFDTNGNLYVGGKFDSINGAPATDVATWNGVTWSQVGNGPPGATSNSASYISSLTSDSTGNVYAGGVFFSSNGSFTATTIVKWSGAAWSTLGASGVPGILASLACDTKGDLVAASGGQAYKWDGASAWSPLGSGVSVGSALAFDKAGNLYAAGSPTNVPGLNVIQWNGSSWTPLASGLFGAPSYSIQALAIDNASNLYAGGDFLMPSVGANNIARWNGHTWAPLGSGVGGGSGIAGYVTSLACDGAGNLYAAGSFTMAGAGGVNNIAKWDGTSWSPMGSGLTQQILVDSTAIEPYVNALALDHSGNLYAVGSFAQAGTNASTYIAKALISGPAPNTLAIANGSAASDVIQFLGAPGASYALDFAATLAPPVNWTAETTNTASTANASAAGYVNFTNPTLGTQGFYRVRRVP